MSQTNYEYERNIDGQEKSIMAKKKDRRSQGNAIQTTAPVPKMAPSALRAPTIDPTPLYARYEVAPRRSSLPMTELIRRASSKPGSPFLGPASYEGSISN